MENEFTNGTNAVETEQVTTPVQENVEAIQGEPINESPLEAPLTDVNNQEGIVTPPQEENVVKDQPEVSDEIQKKLDKLREYEVKENEINELRNKLGSEAPQDNLIFNAQRELSIVENQAQQQYIQLCNEYGVDYRPDKIDQSAQELQEKDPRAFYELRYKLTELNDRIQNKRMEVENFISTRDISLALERNKQVIETSPAIKNVINNYMKDNNLTGNDIDAIVKSSLDIAKEAYEMGRQAALQDKGKVNPAQVLNNNVITQQGAAAPAPTPSLTLADVEAMDIETYAKNRDLIDRLYAEGKLK